MYSITFRDGVLYKEEVAFSYVWYGAVRRADAYAIFGAGPGNEEFYNVYHVIPGAQSGRYLGQMPISSFSQRHIELYNFVRRCLGYAPERICTV